MEQKPHILVVDDEPDICEIVCFNLEMEGYDVLTASNAAEAIGLLMPPAPDNQQRFDLLLLDVMMPDMSGFALTRQLKLDEQTRDIPIIFLTARDTENDVITGLNLGADDYIAKPFRLRELLARVRTVLRRTSAHAEPAPATAEALPAGLVVDEVRKTVSIDNQDAQLSRTEFDLICCLLSERGRVFSRQELIRRVWPKDVVVTERTVDVCITRLRKKVGRHASHILTKSGFGYAFE